MKEKREVFKISKRTLLGIFLVATMFLAAVFSITLVRNDFNVPMTIKEIEHGWYKLTVVGQNVSVGNGLDGVVNIFVYPLASKGDITGSPYNCTEATAYAHGDDVDGWSDGEALTGDVDPAYTWIIAVSVQFSDKAYNTTSSDWDKTLVKCVGTSTDLSISAEEAEEGGDFYEQDGTTDAKLTFYWDNSDAGWSTTTGQTVTFDDFDIYYYA
ncbi:MAG: hypothetical protein BV457_05710 [Thermoplasmata archaeon M9B1D]|nr:MAG: hypothetical protein BV457_05710 [Thermoplasmata archaeon M9B1D]PNX49398.1 MAG: hypothetical protein BV456_09000 [Thermoplasmata archaeon M8B2D]